MLAEEQTAKKVWFVTFTYGGGYNNPDAYWLDYDHVVLTWKRMRKAGHKFKYVTVGEHGGAKDRAHWHAMIYWQTKPPKVKMDERITWEFWDHGTTQIEYPRSNKAASVYIMDYLNKDNLAKNLMKYSKNPMLGQEYLLEYARSHAQKGLSIFLESDRFTVPGSTTASGKPFYYPVGRQTALYEKMLTEYLITWAIERPNQKLRMSEDLSEWLEASTQDSQNLPRVVQAYLKHNYGIEACLDYEQWDRLIYNFKQCRVEITYFQIKVVVLTPEGEITWQNSEVRQDGLTFSLNDAQAYVKRIIKKGPKRLERVFNHSPQNKPDNKTQNAKNVTAK